ncbi:hypothetical protein H6F96_00265 [Microcoleus sp. FACHB-53]|nr:hypothetical protein [Microcoleus sp. FACHB-53]
MKKAYMGLIAISIVQALLVGCASVSDDIARIATKQGSNLVDDVARTASKQGSNVTDDAARQFSKNETRVVPATSQNVNSNKLLKKCAHQAGRSAVVEAWQRQASSDNQASESYLLAAARDAIQRCTVGNEGDQVLDELANLVVSDFKQEQASRQ